MEPPISSISSAASSKPSGNVSSALVHLFLTLGKHVAISERHGDGYQTLDGT